jgi:hypothetical protein
MKAKTSSLNKVMADSFSAGTPTYMIFNTFQEYVFPRDEGRIDQSNIYKVLNDINVMYNQAMDTITPVVTAVGDSNATVAIASPFDFGTLPQAFSFTSDNCALHKSGDTIFVLFTWNIGPGYGVLQGCFNDSTGDIRVDVVDCVLYSDQNKYCTRLSISGNQITHHFTVKFVSADGIGTIAVSFVGTGVSKSDNTEDYFLIKYNYLTRDGATGITNHDARYYRFNVAANEDSLRAYPVNGFAKEDIADPRNYSSLLDTMTMFKLDGSDNATKLSDFANGSIKLTY